MPFARQTAKLLLCNNLANGRGWGGAFCYLFPATNRAGCNTPPKRTRKVPSRHIGQMFGVCSVAAIENLLNPAGSDRRKAEGMCSKMRARLARERSLTLLQKPGHASKWLLARARGHTATLADRFAAAKRHVPCAWTHSSLAMWHIPCAWTECVARRRHERGTFLVRGQFHTARLAELEGRGQVDGCQIGSVSPLGVWQWGTMPLRPPLHGAPASKQGQGYRAKNFSRIWVY